MTCVFQSGLGLAAARELAKSGEWRVIMACRDFVKAEKVAKDNQFPEARSSSPTAVGFLFKKCPGELFGVAFGLGCKQQRAPLFAAFGLFSLLLKSWICVVNFTRPICWGSLMEEVSTR